MKEKPKVGTPEEKISIPMSSILGSVELSSRLLNLSLYYRVVRVLEGKVLLTLK